MLLLYSHDDDDVALRNGVSLELRHIQNNIIVVVMMMIIIIFSSCRFAFLFEEEEQQEIFKRFRQYLSF